MISRIQPRFAADWEIRPYDRVAGGAAQRKIVSEVTHPVILAERLAAGLPDTKVEVDLRTATVKIHTSAAQDEGGNSSTADFFRAEEGDLRTIANRLDQFMAGKTDSALSATGFLDELKERLLTPVQPQKKKKQPLSQLQAPKAQLTASDRVLYYSV